MAEARVPTRFAELELKVLSMNLSGRFSARELKFYGQRAVQYLLEKENIGLFFGHLASFKMAPMENYEFVGTNKAFFLFNTEILRGGDDKQFKQLVRNLQFRGKLSHNYAPENTYSVCKFRARHDPFLQFIAISWPSDECEGKLKSRNNFKHMIKFAADLAYLEQLPVVIGGTAATISGELVRSMPHGFEHFGYKYANTRRATRASQFFVLSIGGIRLTEVRPVICGKIDLNKESHTWKTPEDFFYYDPVKGLLWIEKIKSWGSSLSLLSTNTAEFPLDPVRTIVAKIPMQDSCDDNSDDNTGEMLGGEDDIDAECLEEQNCGSHISSKALESNAHELKSSALSDEQECIPPFELEIKSQLEIDSIKLENEKGSSQARNNTADEVNVEEFEIGFRLNPDPNESLNGKEEALVPTPNGNVLHEDDFDDLHYDWKSTAFCSIS